MKFLEILLSFLATQGKSFLHTNTEAVTIHIVNNARRVTILLSSIVISITLFCIGFSMGYTGLVSAYSSEYGFTFSHTILGGLILCAITLFALTRLLSEKYWLKATGLTTINQVQQNAVNTGPGLDTAFAVLILEIASEMKDRRQAAPKHSEGSS